MRCRYETKCKRKIETRTFRDCVIELIQWHANCHRKIPYWIVWREKNRIHNRSILLTNQTETICVFLFWCAVQSRYEINNNTRTRNSFLSYINAKNMARYGEYLSIFTEWAADCYEQSVYVQMSEFIAARPNEHYLTSATGGNSLPSNLRCGNRERSLTHFRERHSNFPCTTTHRASGRKGYIPGVAYIHREMGFSDFI